jgi:hypothetical protein
MTLEGYYEIEQRTVTALADAMAKFLAEWDHPEGTPSRMLEALVAQARERANILAWPSERPPA